MWALRWSGTQPGNVQDADMMVSYKYSSRGHVRGGITTFYINIFFFCFCLKDLHFYF